MKQIFNITTTDNHDIPQQVLSIRVGEKYIGFSISRRNTDELLQLTWYTADEIDENILREIYLAHPELSYSYYKTVICYEYASGILVPDKYYKQDDSKLLLETMYGNNGNTVVAEDALTEWQLKSIYGVPGDVENWIRNHFPGAIYRHNYTIGIRHIDALDFEGSLIVDFRTEDFLLVVSQSKKILLVQTFPYSTPADVLYYLLKACKEFSFAQQSVRVTVSGLIEKDSALYKELYQYFLNVRFREADWRVPYAEDQSFPAHYFTFFNDIALCES